jgi:hypothetical protein
MGLILAAGTLMLGLPQARAADKETRSFTISVDGKPAGSYQMNIQRMDDGTTVLLAQSDVRVTVLGIAAYTYSYSGKEFWKDGRLQHLISSGKEKGKDFSVRADAEGQGLRVVANGKEHTTRPDVWSTSCWQLPDARYRNNAVALLACDTGADIAGRLDLVGTEKLKVAGQEMTCTHYRVTKDVPHDVWYDAQERLVRDEWVSSGHRSVVEMTSVQH